MQCKEIEFKYRADGIPFSKFREFCSGLKGVVELITPSGTDVFFAKAGDNTTFFRHRRSGLASELTLKKKTTESDNFVRNEYNIDINPEHSENYIGHMLKELGYDREFLLHKNSCVYVGDWFLLSYYICYDDDMGEVGRFIELELREDVDYPTIEAAWDNLLILEKLCRPLGITPLGRIKQSLFEMFRPSKQEAVC